MPMFDAKTLKIENATVVWDGITQPEPSESNGKLRYSLKVVVHPNNPDIGLMHQIANDCLLASEFKGVLPNGGLMPVGTAGPAEFGGMFPGFAVINASTYLQPEVYDEHGKMLSPMEYGRMVYPGQQVTLLVSAYAYNNKSKGVKASLEGVQIIASAQAPRLQIGGGGGMAAKAFGGAQAPAAPAYAQVPAAPAYAQAPAAPAYAQAPKLVPVSPQAQGTPDPAQWTGWTQEMLIAQGHFALQTATPPAAPATPSGGYPAQAHNFLPQ